jgi:CubicO group peptidase (beta-lactamase class C family)
MVNRLLARQACAVSRCGPASLAVRAMLLAALLTAGSVTGLAAQDALPAGWRAAVERLADRLAADVQADDVGGITAAVVLGDSVVWAQGFGWADRERRVPAERGTIYRIGSISKSVTAVAYAQLVERGVLGYDDPVGRHLPAAGGFAGARDGAAPVTLRQLATHTAGLIREPRLAGAASGPIDGWEDKILASIPATSFDTVPGARYAYSNIGYGVLGLAVSRGAGVPFMELVEQRMFAPLGMTSSTFVITPALQPRLAVGYANGGSRIDAEGPLREHAGRGYKVPNGGVYSTVDDLARFIGGLNGARGDAVLNEGTRAEVLRIQTPENPRSGYGLGFSVRVGEDGRRTAGHGGSVAGYTAHLVFDPDAQVGVILLRNYNSGRTSLQGVATALLTELVAAR